MPRCIDLTRLIRSFPNRPLTPREVEQLRATEEVEEVVVLESPAETAAHRGTSRALVLATGSLFAVCHGPGGWTHKLVETDADWVDLHNAAFAWFYE